MRCFGSRIDSPTKQAKTRTTLIDTFSKRAFGLIRGHESKSTAPNKLFGSDVK